MKIIRNEKHVKLRARIGQWASLGGMAVLGLGLVISFTRPQLIGISLACLLMGLLLSQIGLYHTKRWVQRPRPDEVLEKALKGLDNRFELYSFYLPAPHVLLGPPGLFVLRVQHQEGQITCQADRWQPEEAVEVQPLIVFTNDKAELSISESSIPVLPYKKLKPYLRGLGKRGLSAQQRERLSELFATQVT